MTKTYFLLFLCLGLSYNSLAQQYDNDPSVSAYTADAAPSGRHSSGKSGRIDINKLRFGAYFAPATTWMHPTSSKSDDGSYLVSSNGTTFGYAWGLMADYFFADNYGISTGFNVNSTGGSLTNIATSKVDTALSNTVKKADFNYTLQFIELPLALKLRSDGLGGHGTRVFGQIGLTLGINISRKVDYTVRYNDASNTASIATGDNEKLRGTLAVPPVLLQLNLGAGIEYPLSEKLFFYFGLFFNNGFLPSAVEPQNYTMDYAGSFSGTNTRLNSFAFRVGLFF